MNPRQALAFVERHGIVLQSAHGAPGGSAHGSGRGSAYQSTRGSARGAPGGAAGRAVPNLAEAVAGEPIRGSWWGHVKGRAIYAACEAVGESPDVLVCKLLDGKVTFVHRRLWPALVRLSARFPRGKLDRVWNEHTETGAHRARRVAFPEWVPADVTARAARLTEAEADAVLADWPLLRKGSTRRSRGGSK